MGFTVSVEAGYGDELVTRLPTKSGGKAVFAFLSALQYYCVVDESEDSDNLGEWREWFTQLQTHIEKPLCEVFEPIMDCMWGDGGGIGGEFREDEYAWYLKRAAAFPHKMTAAEFHQFVEAGKQHWIPIDKVISNVNYLIHLFKSLKLNEVEALYVAADMIPDFESLYDTLAIFKDYWYDTVRLNFS